MSDRRNFIRKISAVPFGLSGSKDLQFKNESGIFADHWSFIGAAIQEKEYHIWCSSPILDENGKVHLFSSRWPKMYGVDPGWRSHSEIAHYIADQPEGPFLFSDVALKGTNKNTWDKFGMHNPVIYKIDNKYVLLYIANNNYHQPPHPANQNIGMAIAKSLFGPWEKVNGTGLILSPPSNTQYWNHNAPNGVNNPTLFPFKGGYFLYYKSSQARMGLAVAENLTGPYVHMPFPVTSNNLRIEDGYAFNYNNQICILTTDNDGIIKKGGGLLWKSEDGVNFNSYEAGYHLINEYLSDAVKLNPKWHYGNKSIMKFERPQLLIINDLPAYLYVTSGCNIYGGDTAISYVLEFKK